MPGEGEKGQQQGAGQTQQQGAAQQSQGAGHGTGQQQGQSQQTQASQHEGWSSEARANFAALEKKFAESEKRYQEAAERLKANDDTLARLRAALLGEQPEGGISDEAFYSAPAKTVQDIVKAEVERVRREMAEHQEAQSRGSVLERLRSMPDHSEDLENKLARVIKDFGLAALGTEKAVTLAYKHVTGNDFNEASRNGYSTRSLKERLMRPGSGGGAGNPSRDSLLAQLGSTDEKVKKEAYSKLQELYAQE